MQAKIEWHDALCVCRSQKKLQEYAVPFEKTIRSLLGLIYTALRIWFELVECS